MANDPREPFSGTDWTDWKDSWRWRYVWRQRLLSDPGSGLFISPLVYVPAAISGNRVFVACVAGAWVIGQFTTGLTIFFGDVPEDPRPAGAAFWRAVVGQAIGLAPWLVLSLAWVSLGTPGILLLIPVLAAWGMVALLASSEGPSLGARMRASPYWGLALVTGGMWAFAIFVLSLVLVIKASHPLSR